MLLNNHLSTSPEGLNFIKVSEGSVNKAYMDTGNVLTIGVGHVVKKGEPHVITDKQSSEYLKEDLRIAEEAIKKLVTIQLTQQQFDALVSFVFNVGVNAFSRSTLLKKLNSNDPNGASKEFLKWVMDNGKTIKGLVTRRTNESNLFSSGKYI